MALLERIRWGNLLTPVTVFIVGLAASGLTTYQVARIAEEKDRDRVVHIFGQVHDAIDARLSTYIAMLRAGAGFVSAQDGIVSRAEFKRFVDQLQVAAHYPGIQGIGFTAQLTDDGGDPHEALAELGVPDLPLSPPGQRDEIHAIVHLEPLDLRNQAALGYDMYSEPVRREAMQRARDTARPAASGRVQLVQEIDDQVQAGFLIYVPVYRGGTAPFTVAERRKRLIGFVYSPFRADDLMHGIFGTVPRRRADVAIYDGPISNDNLLHRSPDFSDEKPLHVEVRQMDVAGRPWHIRYSTRPAFELSSSRDLVPYVFLAGVLATLILAALAGAQLRAKQRADEAASASEATARKLEVLHATASRFSAELDPERLIQEITEAGRTLSEAQLGVFLHRPRAPGEAYRAPFAVSGATPEQLACLENASIENVVGPEFRTGAVVRAADITSDPRFADNPLLRSVRLDEGPMRSYLAVPVLSRSGELLGGLLFGHAQAGVFTQDAERSIRSLAGHAAIAIDNSKLFKASQEEIAARKKVEEEQKFLLDELNHRVKNTLATVQSIAAQTLRSSPDATAFRKAFEARLIALSAAHDLLSRENWRGVMLHDLVERELAPYGSEDPERVRARGERVWLPARISVPLGMAIHELATNAARHGALSTSQGQVDVQWSSRATPTGVVLSLTWRESGGPPVAPPKRKGFGTRMIERGLKYDLRGDAELDFDSQGFRCTITIPLPTQQAVA